MHFVTLGGKPHLIKEPVFKDLKNILTALNNLNDNALNDAAVLANVHAVLCGLLGECHVRKFRRFCWEAWKIPAPTPEEFATLFAAIPDICGLQPSARSNHSSTNKVNDWDALYWRIIRQTGWDWQTIDTQMTVSRLAAMQENLNQSPAVESLVAAYLGYEYTAPHTLEDEIKDWLASQGLEHG